MADTPPLDDYADYPEAAAVHLPSGRRPPLSAASDILAAEASALHAAASAAVASPPVSSESFVTQAAASETAAAPAAERVDDSVDAVHRANDVAARALADAAVVYAESGAVTATAVDTLGGVPSGGAAMDAAVAADTAAVASGVIAEDAAAGAADVVAGSVVSTSDAGANVEAGADIKLNAGASAASAADTVGRAAAADAPAADNEWHALLPQLKLSGMAQQLAEHCLLQGVLAAQPPEQITLLLDQSAETLRTARTMQALTQALQTYTGRAVRLEFVAVDALGGTPEKRRIQLKQARQAQAERAIAEDPVIQQLQREWGGVVIPGSVRPNSAA